MRDGFSALMWELSCVTPAAHRLWLTVGAVRDSSHQKLFEVCWTSYYSTLCASWTTGQQISPGNSLLSPDWLQTILLFCFCRYNLHLYTLGRRSLICSYLGIYNWLTDWNWFESFWSPWALELQSQCLFSLPEDPLLDDVATWWFWQQQGGKLFTAERRKPLTGHPVFTLGSVKARLSCNFRVGFTWKVSWG